ncbi:uncharacterized protein METZ01_LOCUS149982 [marine metagenome]|uniref:C-type cytochrome n=1 Tax=marine metagenome TaxID=408172 RepID=A0A382A6G3_9ZZZZ
MKRLINLITILSVITTHGIMQDQPKNLQVLKFESERKLKKYMKEIGKDLGVKCTFCHDLNDKSIDTEHKLVAREMMKMQMDLNKQYFAMIGDSLLKHENTLQISCWTCHRGNKEPQLFRPKN